MDTTGAGDSFISGFLSGYLRKYKIKDCMLLGAKYASKVI